MSELDPLYIGVSLLVVLSFLFFLIFFVRSPHVDVLIQANDGNLTIKRAPRAVTEKDERILREVMEELEKQNQEVSGDADE